MGDPANDTRSRAYTDYLSASGALRALKQLPYQTHLRLLKLGRTLEIGCGVGRNFAGMPPGSVGVDHNEHSVAICRGAGYEAYAPADFSRAYAGGTVRFDSLLLAHVIEHMTPEEAAALIATYAPFLRPHARIVVITPQEAGFRTDATHVNFCDFAANRAIVERAGYSQVAAYSFPFPRPAGRFFAYNEFVTIGVRR